MGYFEKLSIFLLSSLLFLGCISSSDQEEEMETEEVASLNYFGPSFLNTKACVKIQVRTLGSNGQTITASADQTFRVTASGSANIYEDALCETRNANIDVLQGEFNGVAYIKGDGEETVTLNYQGSQIGEIEVTKFSERFASSLDGAVFTIEKSNNNKSNIYIGGEFTQIGSELANRIGKINSGGEIDDTFIVQGTGLSSSVNKILLSGDLNDDVFVGGSWTMLDGNLKRRFIKLLQNGSLDQSYIPGTGFSAVVYDMALDSSNNVYVAGRLSNWDDGSGGSNIDVDFLTRFIQSNVPDLFTNTFGTPTVSGIFDLEILDNDQIYAAGAFTEYNGSGAGTENRLIRLNFDGSKDAAFNIGSGFNDDVNRVKAAGSNDVYVIGDFTSYNGATQNRIVRLNADGSKDTAFDIGTGFNGEVLAISVLDNDSVIVGGSFTTYNGTNIERIAKINADGSLDTTFNPGTGFNNRVRDIVSADDTSGDFWIGGEFTEYNGQSQPYLVRLDAQGNLD